VQAVQSQQSAAFSNEGSLRTRLQVFAPGHDGGSHPLLLTADVPIGSWQTAELFLPAHAPGPLQIRPVDRPAVIEVREISVHGHDDGIIWSAKTLPELQALDTAGSLGVLPRKDCCLLFNFGSDPMWVLPSFRDEPGAVVLRIVLCVHKDFAAVAQAIADAYAEIYLVAAEVRSASGERIKTLRESQRQVEAAAAERDHVRLQWQEQLEQNSILESELTTLRAEQEKLRQNLLLMERSRSWRITRPLRSASVWAQRLKKNLD
jgi:hypothetical protein